MYVFCNDCVFVAQDLSTRYRSSLRADVEVRNIPQFGMNVEQWVCKWDLDLLFLKELESCLRCLFDTFRAVAIVKELFPAALPLGHSKSGFISIVTV